MHGVLGVGVVLAEDEGLGDEGAAGEKFGGQGILERLEHGANLGFHHDGAVEVGVGVGEIFIKALPADCASFLAAPVHVEAFLHLATLLGDLGFDAIDLVADVDSISNGPLVAVFHHEVLVEEPDGLLGRCGGETDEEGIEVFEHLSPEAVNGAVTFVRNDEVEGLNRDGGVVGHVFRAAIGGRNLVAGQFVEVRIEVLAAQNRIEALDGADGDASDGVEGVGGEMLDVVNLGELASGVGGNELLELGHGLASEIGAIHEKENALRTGVLDDPVSETARGVGLASSGGHLDQRAQMGGGEGFLKIRDALELTAPEVPRRQRIGEGHDRKPLAQGVGPGEPCREGFRTVKRKHAAGPWFGIAFIAEEGFNAGGFVEERQRAERDGLNELGQVLGVVAGLLGDAREQRAFFLGLGDADRLPIQEQEVITCAGFERRFTQRDATPGGGIELLVILNDPARRDQLRVDLLAGELFRS